MQIISCSFYSPSRFQLLRIEANAIRVLVKSGLRKTAFLKLCKIISRDIFGIYLPMQRNLCHISWSSVLAVVGMTCMVPQIYMFTTVCF